MASRLDNYWRRVHREAFRQARKRVMGAAINVAISVVGILAAIWGLWALGSEDAASDEIIGRLFVAFACIIALGVQYLYWIFKIPGEWDEEAHKRIAGLENQLTPQLEIVWQGNAIREIFTIGSPAEVEARVGSVTVRNRSEFARAQSVEVSLISYKHVEWPSPTILNARVYSDSMQQLVVNINPGREETFDLFRVKHRFDKLMLGPFANRRRNNLEPGQYKIKIIASAETGRQVEEDCFLDFAGYDEVEFRRWQVGDVEKSYLNQPDSFTSHRP